MFVGGNEVGDGGVEMFTDQKNEERCTSAPATGKAVRGYN